MIGPVGLLRSPCSFAHQDSFAGHFRPYAAARFLNPCSSVHQDSPGEEAERVLGPLKRIAYCQVFGAFADRQLVRATVEKKYKYLRAPPIFTFFLSSRTELYSRFCLSKEFAHESFRMDSHLVSLRVPAQLGGMWHAYQTDGPLPSPAIMPSFSSPLLSCFPPASLIFQVGLFSP